MIKTITISFFCVLLVNSISFAQSPYFFKTTKALELEKWDAQEASNTKVATAIANELNSRSEENEKIEQLEAEIKNKLKVEDYFGAEAVKKELEKLKAKQEKASELRKSIESSLATEDYEKAAKHKKSLLDLNKPESVASNDSGKATGYGNTQSLASTQIKAKTTSNAGNMQGVYTTKGNGSLSSGYSSSSKANTDQYGRTESENRALSIKRRKTGIVMLSIGGALVIPSAILIGLAARTVASDGLGPAGAIVGIAALGLMIPGAAILGSSRKYKKRADLLAGGTAYLSPSIINTHSYNGSSINNQPSYGLTLNYEF